MLSKKWLWTFVSAAMILSLFAGCSESASSAETSASDNPSTVSAEETPKTQTAEAAKPDTTPEIDQNSVSSEGEMESVYPLSEELVTLTYWGPDISSSNTALPTYGDLEAYDFWPYVEEQTGVKLDMTIVSMMNEAEQLSLVLASGDYMDIMAINEAQVSGGMTALLNQEIATDIADMVEEYMPNYYTYISADEDTLKLCYNDDGQMAGTRSWAEYYVPNQGLVVRQDLIEKLGLEMPNTIDALHDVLVAFRDYGMDAPLWIGTSGQNAVSIVGAMGSCGYAGDRGSTTDHLYVENDKVVSALTSDNYKDYLELMNQWYAEGLINSDFATNTDMDASTAFMLNNETGVIKAMVWSGAVSANVSECGQS